MGSAKRFFRARAGSPRAWRDEQVLDHGSSAHARVHRYEAARERRSVGSSAHARVHRATGVSRSETSSVLPRTRGFTGSIGIGRERTTVVLPRTRGFTGSSTPRWLTLRRFFRARAGSPLPMLTADGRCAVLPRTRGFTGRAASWCRLATAGSSAHARVHRRLRLHELVEWRFFRARAGSPATSGLRMGDRGFFRARAGSPRPSRDCSSGRLTVLPRTRGFTVRRAGDDRELSMVLPRTRGFTYVRVLDGHGPSTSVLPRTRGFTVLGLRDARSRTGSSAHARVHRTGHAACTR